MNSIYETNFPGLTQRGKVRDTYELNDNLLLMIVTDRISAFDVVLPDPIPTRTTERPLRILMASSNPSRHCLCSLAGKNRSGFGDVVNGSAFNPIDSNTSKIASGFYFKNNQC